MSTANFNLNKGNTQRKHSKAAIQNSVETMLGNRTIILIFLNLNRKNVYTTGGKAQRLLGQLYTEEFDYGQ